jgi:hypothetical protein
MALAPLQLPAYLAASAALVRLAAGCWLEANDPACWLLCAGVREQETVCADVPAKAAEALAAARCTSLQSGLLAAVSVAVIAEHERFLGWLWVVVLAGVQGESSGVTETK